MSKSISSMAYTPYTAVDTSLQDVFHVLDFNLQAAPHSIFTPFLEGHFLSGLSAKRIDSVERKVGLFLSDFVQVL